MWSFDYSYIIQIQQQYCRKTFAVNSGHIPFPILNHQSLSYTDRIFNEMVLHVCDKMFP